MGSSNCAPARNKDQQNTLHASLVMFGRIPISTIPSKNYCLSLFCRFQCSQITSRGPLVTLKMLTKQECQLCDKALIEIEENLSKEMFERIHVVKVDIIDDGNESLYDRWRFEIPVFYLNDKFLCKNRIDIVKLIEKMK